MIKKKSTKRYPTVLVPSLAMLTVVASSVAAAQQGSDLPRIIGTQLPGTAQSMLDISIDGNRISTVGNDYGGLLPDMDGDGIVDAYLKAVEPGETCTTLILLPSKQARAAQLQSDDLGAYTRIRNFDSQNAAEGCDDYNPGLDLQVLGDLTGDGIPELSTRSSGEGQNEIVINGALANGTLIESGNPIAGQVSRIAGNTDIQPVGDIDGDGRVDLYLRKFDDTFDAVDDGSPSCVIYSSSASLPAEISIGSLAGSTALATFSLSEYDACPFVTAIGDVNGDGASDIAITVGYEGDTHVVHGEAGLELDDDFAENGYRIQGVYLTNDQRAFDFDGDGFDDVLMPAYAYESNRLLAGTGTLIAYGSPDGLITAEDFPTRENGVVTELIHKFEKPVWHSQWGWNNVLSPKSVGDINGDGADDLLIINYNYSFDAENTSGNGQKFAIVYGTPGKRFPVLLEASVDGGNGVYWSEENGYLSSLILAGDFTGDGIDDLAYGDRVIEGASRTRLATEPQYVRLFDGPDSLDISWSLPEDPSSLNGYRIVSNGQTVAQLETYQNQYRVDRDAGQAITELRVQSIDEAGNVIGEVVRQPDLTEPEFAAILGDFKDAEYNARGSIVPADTYTLTGKSYGPELGELFWNTTKRFVLVWRNGEIVDRVEGNSYMVNGGGEYFITTDYAGSIPDDGNTGLFASGTLRRSNVVSVNATDTDTPVEPPVTDGLPAAPANLRAAVYSNTAAEIFWDRAVLGDNVTSYLIRRNGEDIASTTGISLFDSTRQPGQEYTYTVIAVDRFGARSNPSTVTTEIYGEVEEPTAESLLPLSGQVYSSTALELFWNVDELENAGSLRYEVLRDGQSVSLSNARSYFVNTLRSNTTYRFELLAINAQGDEVARSPELLLTTR